MSDSVFEDVIAGSSAMTSDRMKLGPEAGANADPPHTEGSGVESGPEATFVSCCSSHECISSLACMGPEATFGTGAGGPADNAPDSSINRGTGSGAAADVAQAVGEGVSRGLSGELSGHGASGGPCCCVHTSSCGEFEFSACFSFVRPPFVCLFGAAARCIYELCGLISHRFASMQAHHSSLSVVVTSQAGQHPQTLWGGCCCLALRAPRMGAPMTP